MFCRSCGEMGSRTPHGVRGLKFDDDLDELSERMGRTPHGVRGLKYQAWF